MIVFGCIAPHGDVDEPPELLAAMEELGHGFEAASPDAALVATPHNVHVERHFAVITAAKVGEEHDVDRALAHGVIEAFGDAGLPVVGVSYGGNDASQAEHPLDWGTEVPLRFMGGRPVVVIAPARDRLLAEHVLAGEVLAGLPGRHALIASADQGHAHRADGPYGFDAAAAEYDALARDLVERTPLDFEPLARLVEAGKADSLWQMLVLQGALGPQGRLRLLQYSCPTYYGMLVASSG